MAIVIDMLKDYGAVVKTYHKNELIFREGTVAFYYYQVHSGLVKMINMGGEKDFIQGIFTEGESFGEPPIMCEFPYPASAVAIIETELLALPRKHFLNLLLEQPLIHLQFSKLMCRRIEYKSRILKNLNQEIPEDRILAVIDLLKNKLSRDKYGSGDEFVVPVTRQEIADMTGLRVETVIRKVGMLEDQGKLRIEDRKIFRPYN